MDNDQIIIKIVNDLIIEEARPEALKILSFATPLQLMDFLQKYNEKKYNSCGMLLDSIKLDLVRTDVMLMKPDDFFGKPLI